MHKFPRLNAQIRFWKLPLINASPLSFRRFPFSCLPLATLYWRTCSSLPDRSERAHGKGNPSVLLSVESKFHHFGWNSSRTEVVLQCVHSPAWPRERAVDREDIGFTHGSAINWFRDAGQSSAWAYSHKQDSTWAILCMRALCVLHKPPVLHSDLGFVFTGQTCRRKSLFFVIRTFQVHRVLWCYLYIAFSLKNLHLIVSFYWSWYENVSARNLTRSLSMFWFQSLKKHNSHLFFFSQPFLFIYLTFGTALSCSNFHQRCKELQTMMQDMVPALRACCLI